MRDLGLREISRTCKSYRWGIFFFVLFRPTKNYLPHQAHQLQTDKFMSTELSYDGHSTEAEIFITKSWASFLPGETMRSIFHVFHNLE